MHQDLCRILDVEVPIISAPMGGAISPQFAAAVSRAGAFPAVPLWGISTGGVLEGIAALRACTDQNFAVNLNLDFDYQDQLQVLIDAGVFAVSLFWGMDTKAIEKAKKAGLVVLVTVGTAKEAKTAASAGADVIVAQGWEAGGHVWGKVATMALIPAVVDAVDVPVVAAGGIADGRGMAAAMMLGASGVWIGTRFLASHEANIHDDYRQRLLAATEDQTEWYHDLYDVDWPDAPHRALVSETSRAWQKAGSPPSGQRPNEGEVLGQTPDGRPVVRYQSYTPKSDATGDIAAMSMWSGQGVAQARKVMPVAEIIDEIWSDARKTIRTANQQIGGP